jgi:hypothetical protein
METSPYCENPTSFFFGPCVRCYSTYAFLLDIHHWWSRLFIQQWFLFQATRYKYEQYNIRHWSLAHNELDPACECVLARLQMPRGPNTIMLSLSPLLSSRESLYLASDAIITLPNE